MLDEPTRRAAAAPPAGGTPRPPRVATAPSGDRCDWVDHARGLGILLVVYGHVMRGLLRSGIVPQNAFLEKLDQAIYAFHMPLFFFLSGMYFLPSLRRRGPVALGLWKVDTVLYPYLVWSILHGSVRVALAERTNHDPLGVLDVLRVWVPIDQYWFLFGLFFIFLLATLPFAAWIPRQPRTGLALLLIGSLAVYGGGVDVPFVWQEVFVFPFLLHFALGVLVATAAAASGRRWSGPRTGAGLLAGALAVAGLLAAVRGGDLLREGMSFEGGADALILAIAGIAGTCGLARLTAAAGLGGLTALGAGSLLIYLAHTLPAGGVRILLDQGLGFTQPGVHLALGLVVALGVPLAFARLAGPRRTGLLLRAPAWLSCTRLAAWWAGRPRGAAAGPAAGHAGEAALAAPPAAAQAEGSGSIRR
ncbi:acyltransferase family protein [Phycisphaera mikurensis]|uniref:Putative acyltransferase n=1 Tax=Phycisphaera mikurensis (strain NBRC 102666 / KCTC 22515 / FYK2301M01) TaxID=1142394 RepID=I0IAZ0_PHYMF|nr:acyltransferase family protein [Phycisphaera mikurensis]MBB6442600.1 fucose 4-O-acetylase-like acetyltransferase [Phycisphaera mikurensis]BAM02428.1 putative acyltransferase [Phycisphaera mikurensis NBRC 102666]